MKRLALVVRAALIGGAVWSGGLGARPLTAEEASAKVDYVRQVRPILDQHCIRCHGAAKQESSLRLDTAAGAREGGDSGPAVMPGKADQSLLILAVTGSDDASQMPPEGAPLSTQQISVLRSWIDQGAQAPAEKALIPGADHWSFQPIVRPPLPAVKDPRWAQNAIDLFVLARLEQEKIAPAPQADRATLIRRLSLDLLGLLPAVEEVEAFVADERPDAYERLVDRLLASPAYGERWGRHWLDLARYADSNGYTRDFARSIWKYREWVIGAINRDLPFDQFTIEQIAGDMLPGATLDQIVATGFHRNTLINEEGGTDPEQFRIEAVADRVATTGAVFLGLTLGCARCHGHKYDPITQKEFYQLFAFLNNCDEPKIDAPSAQQVASGELERLKGAQAQLDELEKELEAQRAEFEKKQVEWEEALPNLTRMRLPSPVLSALAISLKDRSAAEKKLVEDVYRRSDEARRDFPVVDKMFRLTEAAPKIPTTMVMRERKTPRETFVHRRGDFLDHGPKVDPAVPAVLYPLPKDVEHASRMDFARWLVAPEGTLTPRVVVNRYWQQFFGQGIVTTENDFGTQGDRPSHPQLLDWLAREFVDDGWSPKRLHRLIVTSATYRQSSHVRPELAEIDPANRLLARQTRLRLEAEIVRDASLSASGLLTCVIGGPSVYPPQPAGVFAFTQDPKPWPTAEGADRFRRGMYTYFWRSSPYPALVVFDAPNGNVTCTRRVRSNTPLQALTLANDVAYVECAQSLARQTVEMKAKNDSQRVEHLFQACLARKPTSAERRVLSTLVKNQRAQFQADAQAAEKLAGEAAAAKDDRTIERAVWTAVARVVLNLDEFITRE